MKNIMISIHLISIGGVAFNRNVESPFAVPSNEIAVERFNHFFSYFLLIIYRENNTEKKCTLSNTISEHRQDQPRIVIFLSKYSN